MSMCKVTVILEITFYIISKLFFTVEMFNHYNLFLIVLNTKLSTLITRINFLISTMKERK